MSTVSNAHLFLIVLVPGGLSSGCQHVWVLGGLFQAADGHFLLCPHIVEREQASSLGPHLHKGTNPIHEGCTLMT